MWGVRIHFHPKKERLLLPCWMKSTDGIKGTGGGGKFQTPCDNDLHHFQSARRPLVEVLFINEPSFANQVAVCRELNIYFVFFGQWQEPLCSTGVRTMDEMWRWLCDRRSLTSVTNLFGPEFYFMSPKVSWRAKSLPNSTEISLYMINYKTNESKGIFISSK